jgi:hypothetical protein
MRSRLVVVREELSIARSAHEPRSAEVRALHEANPGGVERASRACHLFCVGADGRGPVPRETRSPHHKPRRMTMGREWAGFGIIPTENLRRIDIAFPRRRDTRPTACREASRASSMSGSQLAASYVRTATLPQPENSEWRLYQDVQIARPRPRTLARHPCCSASRAAPSTWPRGKERAAGMRRVLACRRATSAAGSRDARPPTNRERPVTCVATSPRSV